MRETPRRVGRLIQWRLMQLIVAAVAAAIVATPMPAAGEAAADATSYFAPENVYRFAEYLQREGDYLRATGEYERYLVMGPDGGRTADALWNLGCCYRSARLYPKACGVLKRFVIEYAGDVRRDLAVLMIADAYRREGDPATALSYLDSQAMADPEALDQAQRLRCVNHLLLRKWQEAQDDLRALAEGTASPPDTIDRQLLLLAHEVPRRRKKSPLLAGVLSAVIPGAGRVYTGRTMDGLSTLAAVAASAVIARSGFQDTGSGSGKGWAFATLAAGLYAGNIHGSVADARAHNDREEADLERRICAVADELVP